MKDSDINTRLNSADNLLNRLKLSTNRSSVILPEKNYRDSEVIDIPSLPSNQSRQLSGRMQNKSVAVLDRASSDDESLSIDDLIDDLDTKIQIGRAHTTALEVMNKSLNRLSNVVDDIDSPGKLTDIARTMHKIVHDNAKPNEMSGVGAAQIVIWKPVMVNAEDMNIVQVAE